MALKGKKASKKVVSKSKKKKVSKQTSAAMALGAGLVCGTVDRNVGSLSPSQIKKKVLAAAAFPGGAPLPMSTPDDTPVAGGLRNGNGDQIWPLAQICMQQDTTFHADGLRIRRLYVLANGKTLGEFVSCIKCCYSHKRTG